MLVRFVRKAYVDYQAIESGTVTELSDDLAQRLIGAGVAVVAAPPVVTEEAVAPAAVEIADAPESPRRRGRR